MTHGSILQHSEKESPKRGHAIQHPDQHAITHCNILQRIATHSNTQQYTEKEHESLETEEERSNIVCKKLRHATTHCNILQQNAVHCTMLQHTITQGNTRQHTVEASRKMKDER